MRNKNVNPEEVRSSEGICQSLGCEVLQADTVLKGIVYPRRTYSTEVPRTIPYTTRNIVNRIARKQFNSNPVVLELSKEKQTSTSSSKNISFIR